MMRRCVPLLLLACCFSAFAEEEIAAVPDESVTTEAPGFSEWLGQVSPLLGATLEDVYKMFGVPLRVRSVRGEESWQDDVVFEYGGGLSLFWYRDRVWQLRFGPDFGGKFSDAGMGSSREEFAAVLGDPFYAQDDWMLYHFAGEGYPLRVRLFFGENGLEDIYIFRGDF
jgi:hypothetical protein